MVSGQRRHVHRLLLDRIVGYVDLIFHGHHESSSYMSSVQGFVGPHVVSYYSVIYSSKGASLRGYFPFRVAITNGAQIEYSSIRMFFHGMVGCVFLRFLFGVRRVVQGAGEQYGASYVICHARPTATTIFFLGLVILVLPSLRHRASRVVTLFFRGPNYRKKVCSPKRSGGGFTFTRWCSSSSTSSPS